MYSKKLEKLIQMSIEDGVVDDASWTVLLRRAKEEGVDPDELTLYVNSLLKKQTQKASENPMSSTKMGNLMKCPNCGAPYEPGTYKCSQCGHIFQNIEAVKSSVRFNEGIQKLMDEGGTNFFGEVKNRDQIVEYIKNFPVPTAKEDIVDFLLSLYGKKSELSPFQMGYIAKFKEVSSKAKILFAGDPQVEAAIKEVSGKGNWWNEQNPITKLFILGTVVPFIGFIIILLLYFILK